MPKTFNAERWNDRKQYQEELKIRHSQTKFRNEKIQLGKRKMKKIIITLLITFVTIVQANPSYIGSDGKSVYTEATQAEYDALSPQEKYQAVFTNATKEEYDAMVARTKVEEQQASNIETATQANTTERVTTTNLEFRDNIGFLPNENIPFTGRFEEFYPNGQKKGEVHWKDGRLIGVSIWWHENGQKKSEQDNSNNNMRSWYENGQKKDELIYINGQLNSVTEWYENGQKKSEQIGSGSSPFDANTWYENGKKAQGKNDKNQVLHWDENGKEISLEEYMKRFNLKQF